MSACISTTLSTCSPTRRRSRAVPNHYRPGGCQLRSHLRHGALSVLGHPSYSMLLPFQSSGQNYEDSRATRRKIRKNKRLTRLTGRTAGEIKGASAQTADGMQGHSAQNLTNPQTTPQDRVERGHRCSDRTGPDWILGEETCFRESLHAASLAAWGFSTRDFAPKVDVSFNVELRPVTTSQRNSHAGTRWQAEL